MISQSGQHSPSVVWPPTSISIEAPIEQVWATLMDESKLPLWFAGCPRLSYPDEETRRANPTGQVFILTFPNLGGPREVHGEYALFAPPDRVVMRFRDQETTHLVTYALRSEGSRTTLSVTSESEYRSRVLRVIDRLLGGPRYRSVAENSLSRFKSLVERG